MPTAYLVNARVVSPELEIGDAAIALNEGLIETVITDGKRPEGPVVFDAEGATVVPGFFDIHTHGAAGHDVCNGRSHAVHGLAKAKLNEGVTSFLPTTLTLPEEQLLAALQNAADYYRNQTHAKTPGIHLEGPFINPQYAGAQNPRYMRRPDLEEIERYHDIFPLAIVSLAPEMPGGSDLISALDRMGIVPSLAHSAATYEQYRQARRAGAKHLTHFCNQMSPLHHREIGLVGAGMLDREVMVEIICDRIHLNPEMIQLAYQTIGPERLMIITDSMAASGLEKDQTTYLGGLEVIVRDGAARLPSGALAGSTLKMNEALANVAQITARPLKELVRMTSLNQATALRLPRLGRIAPGYYADLVVLNDDFSVRTVFVDGVEHPPASRP